MYKLTIEGGIATEKNVGIRLDSGEIEVTAEQFYSADLPCVATVSDGVVTIGSHVGYDQVPVTTGADPVFTTEEWETAQRRKRDSLLAATDYTQIPDADLTTDCVAAFAVYRQGLRDLTEQAGWPTDVQWAEEPVAEKIS